MQIIYPEIAPATLTEKSILHNLMELYQYDFSEYDQADVNPAGQFAYPYLDLYWIEPNRHPFIVRVQDKLAGFVLVNRHVDPIFQELRWSVAEFFILSSIFLTILSWRGYDLPHHWIDDQTGLK